MRMPAIVLSALLLAGCAPASVSQSVFARPLLDTTTVGGVGYPLVVEGAEGIGADPVLVAQNMRFPAGLGAGSSFRAIAPGEAPPTHAHLHIRPGQPLAPSTLTFVHGDRRIGVGTFSLAPAAYRDPRALGPVSSILIRDMLIEATRNGSDEWLFLRPRFF